MLIKQGELFKTSLRYTYRRWKRNLIREKLCKIDRRYMGMNKKELIASIAEIAEIKKVEAEKALNAFIEVVTEALSEGERVKIVGFGTFYVTERAERSGRNPRTGEEIRIPAKKVVKFKQSKNLLQA